MWRIMMAAAMAMTAGVAKADTYQSFNITGTYDTFADGPGTFGGAATIDVTSETLFSITVTGLPDITFETLPGPGFNAEVVDYSVGEGTVGISMTPDGLGDGFYSGGTFGPVDVSPPAGVASTCSSDPSVCLAAVDTFQGTLTATPLPAALPLFASGIGAMGFFNWRRKRKAAAPAGA
jgi:hypothetical protein